MLHRVYELLAAQNTFKDMDFAIYAPRAFMEFVKNASKRITFLYEYPAVKEPMEVVHWLIFTSRMYNCLVHGAPDVMDWIGLDLAWGQARAQAMVPDTHELRNQRMLKRPPTAFLLFMKEFKEAQSNNKITTSVNSFANCSSTHTVAFASCSSTHTVAMAITCTVGSKTKAADLSSDDHNYEQTEPATYDNAQLLGVLATVHGSHGGYNQILPVQVPVAMPIAAETQPVVVQVCESTFIPSRLQLMYTPGEFPLSSDTQSAKFYRMASNILSKANYNHYEVSSYSKDGFECKHNYTYWNKNALCDGSASVAVPVDHTGISEVRTIDTHTPITITGNDRPAAERLSTQRPTRLCCYSTWVGYIHSSHPFEHA
ncbi:oxygen-independent coproporphyrinogen-III oxidase-like protein sll1917 [Tanacetum coccineum]